jgi:hypothetical protein
MPDNPVRILGAEIKHYVMAIRARHHVTGSSTDKARDAGVLRDSAAETRHERGQSR